MALTCEQVASKYKTSALGEKTPGGIIRVDNRGPIERALRKLKTAEFTEQPSTDPAFEAVLVATFAKAPGETITRYLFVSK